MSCKPFTPDEAREIIKSLQKPAVFMNMTSDWPSSHWSAEQLSSVTDTIRFRIGRSAEDPSPVFETECSYVQASLKEFLCWTDGDSESFVGPFSDFPCAEFWAYADYKYIAQLFQDKPAMFQDVIWSDFGFPGRDARDSSLWIGTRGANTPCHLDSYGSNLVFQIQGRKRWHLFPPDDTCCLYPTRVPYEESSIFSQVNVLQPDLKKFPAFQRARVHTVTLEPGQVLFVPRHWWHYVESVDPVTVSVNTWIEIEKEDEIRVCEALTRIIVCAVKTTPSSDNEDHWLNPTEEGVSSHDENMQYLNLAVKACVGKRRDCTGRSRFPAEQPRAESGKRDSSGLLKTPESGPSPSFMVPFGPHLIPINCEGHQAQKHRCTCSKETSCLSYPPLCPSRPQSQHKDEDKRQLVSAQEAHQEERSSDRTGRIISTNDLLECLVHPEVISRVTRLLLLRQEELHST